MLILCIKINEEVFLDVPVSDKPQRIKVMVTDSNPRQAFLGFTADRSVKILRAELVEKTNAETK